VALDEELAEGHGALGLLRLLDDWDWEAADAETGRAIELAPSNPYVYWQRGVFLAMQAVAMNRFRSISMQSRLILTRLLQSPR